MPPHAYASGFGKDGAHAPTAPMDVPRRRRRRARAAATLLAAAALVLAAALALRSRLASARMRARETAPATFVPSAAERGVRSTLPPAARAALSAARRHRIRTQLAAYGPALPAGAVDCAVAYVDGTLAELQRLEARTREEEAAGRTFGFFYVPVIAARVRIVRGELRYTLHPAGLEASLPWHTKRVVHFAEIFMPLLAAAAREYSFPDADFLFGMTDEPAVCPEQRGGARPPAPVLAWNSQRGCSAQVHFPGYDFFWTVANFTPGAAWRFDTLTENEATPWDAKEPRAVFRGSSSGIPQRDELARRTRNCTDRSHVDCAVWPFDVGMVHGGQAGFLSAAQQQRFKYVLDIDGYVSSLRLKNLLLSTMAVLRVESTSGNAQFYDAELKAFEHYVPVSADLSDLEERVEWAWANDAGARAVAEAGTRFAYERLSLQDVWEYERAVLEELGAMGGGAGVRLEGCAPGVDAAGGCWGDAGGRAPARGCSAQQET